MKKITTYLENWKKANKWFSIHKKSENHRSSIKFFQVRENSGPGNRTVSK